MKVGDSVPKDFPGVAPVLASERQLRQLASRVNRRRMCDDKRHN